MYPLVGEIEKLVETNALVSKTVIFFSKYNKNIIFHDTFC